MDIDSSLSRVFDLTFLSDYSAWSLVFLITGLTLSIGGMAGLIVTFVRDLPKVEEVVIDPFGHQDRSLRLQRQIQKPPPEVSADELHTVPQRVYLCHPQEFQFPEQSPLPSAFILPTQVHYVWFNKATERFLFPGMDFHRKTAIQMPKKA